MLFRSRRLDYRLVVGQGDFRMAASSGIVFAEALLGRDGRVSAQPGAWYPEEVLSLNRVEASLRRAGIDVTKTDHDRVGSASVSRAASQPLLSVRLLAPEFGILAAHRAFSRPDGRWRRPGGRSASGCDPRLPLRPHPPPGGPAASAWL